MADGKMTNEEIATELTSILARLTVLIGQFNAAGHPCKSCGMTVRESQADFHGRLALEAAHSRVAKVRQTLLSGAWIGRSLIAGATKAAGGGA